MTDTGGTTILANYLGALNPELVVGLSRRRRILAEVEDHLLTRAEAEVQAGATPAEAMAAAVAATGPAAEMAAGFRPDLVGRIDRRLTPWADAADRLAMRRPFVGDWPETGRRSHSQACLCWSWAGSAP